MRYKKDSFVHGAVVLSLGGIIVKILGMLFRVPLVYAIGTVGMGYYNMAYPVFSLCIVLAASGFPAAISKIVAKNTSLESYERAYAALKKSVVILCVLGAVFTLFMIFASGFLAENVMSQPKGKMCMIAIAPGIFFVAVTAAYRGYFQGLSNMTHTAVSQVLEQCVKVALGLLLAFTFAKKGAEFGAAGALAGVSIGEGVSYVYILLAFKKYKKENKNEFAVIKKKCKNCGEITKELLGGAIPITLGACIMPALMTFDASFISKTLQNIGYSLSQTASIYGTLTGVVNPLVNMPTVFSMALCLSLVPAIASAFSQNNIREAEKKSSFAIKTAVVTLAPFVVMFFIAPEGIIRFVFRSLPESEVLFGGALLKYMSVGMFFLILVQTMTGILQGMSRQILPVLSLLCGAGVKILCNMLFVENFGIKGAVMGTIACYMTACVMDGIFIGKYLKLRFGFGQIVLKPFISCCGMGFIMCFLYGIIKTANENAAVFFACTGGLLVYCAFIILTGCITNDEMRRFTQNRFGKRERK